MNRYPNRIRELRKARGVSRARLAQMVELHMVTVYRHESGQTKISTELAMRYARALEVQVLDLFFDRATRAHAR